MLTPTTVLAFFPSSIFFALSKSGGIEKDVCLSISFFSIFSLLFPSSLITLTGNSKSLHLLLLVEHDEDVVRFQVAVNVCVLVKEILAHINRKKNQAKGLPGR